MRTISCKLTFAFLMVAVIAAVLVAVIVRLTSPDRLNSLLRDQEQNQLETLLIDYYVTHHSFEGVEEVLQASLFLPSRFPKDQPDMRPEPSLPVNRLLFALADDRGVVLISLLPNYPLGARLSPLRLAEGSALKVDDQVVGTLFIPPDRFVLTREEQDYLDRTNQALWLAAVGAIAVALIGGILLARSFSRPLRSLTSAARCMAAGDLEQDVPVTSKDEIGELTQAFNSMSQAVAHANQLRRQMTADIAHDLRTPLTVIGGYIESMQEGVLDVTSERLAIIRSEIERLHRMVEDLRTLSRADAGELALVRQAVDPGVLLERVAAVYRHSAEQKQVTLQVEAAAGLPAIQVDEARMVQVLGNLMDNALRYTPEGGVITLEAGPLNGDLQLCVEDNGPGIPPQDLPHVFERFYRADRSRSDADGASGLGLAIARALVQAHGGQMHAESVLGRGTKMIICLPRD